MNVKQPIQPASALQLLQGKAAKSQEQNLLSALVGGEAQVPADAQFGAVLDQEMIQAMQMNGELGANTELSQLKAEQLLALQNAETANAGETLLVENQEVLTTETPDPELQALLMQNQETEVGLVENKTSNIQNLQNISSKTTQGLHTKAQELSSQAPALELLKNSEVEGALPANKMAATVLSAQAAYGVKKPQANLTNQVAVVGNPIMMNDIALKGEVVNGKSKIEGLKNYSQFSEKKMINPKHNAAIVDKEAATIKLLETSPTQTEQAVQALAPVETSSKLENQLKGTDAPKVLNLNQVDFSQGADKVIDQISNYIIQAKTSKIPTLDVKVQHDELGLINIHVEKAKKGEMVNLVIQTHSPEANMILKANQQDLLANLSTAGVSVGEFKLETNNSNSTASHKEFSQNQNQENSKSKEHFGSEQNQRRHEQERRQNLWDILKDKEAA